jgi:cytochrome b
MRKILVWDAPVRAFHWTLVACFIGAWVTGDSEKFRLWHLAFGYTASALVLFRVLWGMIGTRYARFSSFVSTPKKAMEHLSELMRGSQRPYLGHNPLGGWMMLSLMGCILLLGLSGYLLYYELIDEDELHEGLANLCITLVIFHVIAAIVMSRLEKENLIKSMWTGYKTTTTDARPVPQRALIAIVLLCSAIYFFLQLVLGALPVLTQ